MGESALVCLSPEIFKFKLRRDCMKVVNIFYREVEIQFKVEVIFWLVRLLELAISVESTYLHRSVLTMQGH